jgi:hypothetical protein
MFWKGLSMKDGTVVKLVSCNNPNQVGITGKLIRNKRDFYMSIADPITSRSFNRDDECMGIVGDKTSILFEKYDKYTIEVV